MGKGRNEEPLTSLFTSHPNGRGYYPNVRLHFDEIRDPLNQVSVMHHFHFCFYYYGISETLSPDTTPRDRNESMHMTRAASVMI